MATKKETQIAKLMKAFNVTKAEALEIYEEDLRIDKMTMKKLNADLTPEEKKAQKEARKIGARKTPTIYKFDTKSKKKDDEKVEIVKKVFDFVKNVTENCEIANEGQEISFKMGETSYSLVLTKHRPKKK